MKNNKKSLWGVIGLIAIVSAVLTYVTAGDSVLAKLISKKAMDPGPLTISAVLVQDKVLHRSDGKVAVALTMNAQQIEPADSKPDQNVDLVIVLDRSGSMTGQKISDARQAVVNLIDRLTEKDRLALVTYSNGVHTLSSLKNMDSQNRRQVKALVGQIRSGGGTNLGGGMHRGIGMLLKSTSDGHHRKVILISDGLANHGITDPNALGNMASGAAEHNFAVSTVGVGYDFNEILMTTIADHGAGNYYFLENPNAFAQVFEKEFESTRNVAASGLEVRIPLEKGVQLIHAGGYPIENKDGYAVIRPGDLLSGQQRKLFLTFMVPTDKQRKFDLGGFKVRYSKEGVSHQTASNGDLVLACVADKKAVMASIDKAAWGEQVVKEDYNQLKEQVANAIRKGNKNEALKQIHEYEKRNRAINAAAGSPVVTQNLEKDVQGLRQSVDDTFVGSQAEVAEKKKQRSKALQYESYRIRRDKK